MAQNVPEKERMVDLDPLMPELRRLDWSAGLTREDLRARMAAFPSAVYMLLPSEREFRSPDEMVAFYRHSWLRSRQQGIPAAGAAADGGPAAWGPSPPSTGARAVGGTHGVGSGADSGYTGSDEVGTGPSGATYGPGSETAPEDQ